MFAKVANNVSSFADSLASYYKSNNKFCRDNSVSGEVFRLHSDNQYFAIVHKDTKISDLKSFSRFVPLDHIKEPNDLWPASRVLDETECILVRLEMTKNKKYFIEGDQTITSFNPDVTVMNMPLHKVRQITPAFVPVPDILGNP